MLEDLEHGRVEAELHMVEWQQLKV